MGIQNPHLSEGQRAVIEVLCQYGASQAAIARHLGRHRSTVLRESRRGWCASFSRYLCEFGRRYCHYFKGEVQQVSLGPEIRLLFVCRYRAIKS